jgi:hypothetical protein
MVAAGFVAAIGVFVSPPPSNRRRSRVSSVAVVRAAAAEPFFKSIPDYTLLLF